MADAYAIPPITSTLKERRAALQKAHGESWRRYPSVIRSHIKTKEQPEPKPGEVQWSRSETIALARHQCTACHGLGLRRGRAGKFGPCNCVLRAIFRACFARYRYIVQYQDRIRGSATSITRHGRDSRYSWGRKNEEYLADFYLTAKRTLTEPEFSIFRLHFLLGADWRACCLRLHTDRGAFFHAVYRIEQKLGRVFRELQPYALYPLDDYFSRS